MYCLRRISNLIRKWIAIKARRHPCAVQAVTGECGAAVAEVLPVSIDTNSHPLAKFAGMLKDDPLVRPWKQAMAEYRDAH
jgi:hypothetical protein